MPRRVALYAGGFNFYYGVTDPFRAGRDKRGYPRVLALGLRRSGLQALLERHFLRADDRLCAIRYFTAAVTAAVETTGRPGEQDRCGTAM